MEYEKGTSKCLHGLQAVKAINEELLKLLKVYKYMNDNECISISTIGTFIEAFSKIRNNKVAIEYAP